MEAILQFFTDAAGNATLVSIYQAVLRIAMPVLAFFIVLRCARSLLGFRREPEIWAWLRLSTGELVPVTHWENLIGRKKTADIVLDFATVSKNHAVLTRHDDGSWTVRDVGARGHVSVNGTQIIESRLEYGDVLSLGGLEMQLEPISIDEAKLQTRGRTKAGKGFSPGLTLVLLTILQGMALLSLCFNMDREYTMTYLMGFGEVAALEWLLFIGQKIIRRSGFEIETIAFFLMTIGLCVVGTSAPEEMQKQVLTACAGVVIFLIIGLCLRNLDTAKKVRYLAAVGGVLLLLVNLVFGKEIYGAKNWIQIGGYSFQPSELVKICFIFAGASTMERIVSKRNLVLFIVYAGFVCACLALMRDFGTALIFFVCFLVISYLRSGSYATIALMCAVVAFGAVLAVQFFPYVVARFSNWGHIWEDPLGKGYQQTNALMCAASGGLFGLGFGNGWLKYVAAADTDLVFALVCEEGGLILSVLMVAALSVLGMFVVRSSRVGRSSFYTISACAAMSIMIVQVILNMFGTVDFLPLTGVTFPFVSNGGSSMLASWGLLAFIKGCDTRQNASFAVKLSVKRKDLKEAKA